MIKLYPFYAVVLLMLFHSIIVAQTPTMIAETSRQGYSRDDGAASLALLHHPRGLAVDAADNINIAEYANSRIHKVRAEDQTVVTIAGTGVNGYNGDSMDARSAQLNTPMGVAVDGEGNVYIADDGNYPIRRIEAATRQITTVAGTSVRGFSAYGGPATRAWLGAPLANQPRCERQFVHS